MRKKGLLTILAGICLICFAASAVADTTLKIGTGPVGGNWFPLGAVVATIINENVPGVSAAPTLGGGVQNIKALNSGTQDFSLTIATTNQWAWEGKAPTFKAPLRNARSVFNTYINVMYVYAPENTGIKSIQDLKGKSVSLGRKNDTQRAVWTLVLKEMGIDVKTFFGRDSLFGYAEAARMMKDRRLDSFLMGTMPPSAPFLEVDTFTPLNIFSCPPDIQKTMLEKYPGIGTTVVPAGSYKKVKEDIRTIGYPCVFACRKDLPEDVMYNVTKAFWENYQRAWKVNPNFKTQISPDNAINGLALPLHKGAYKYYTEKGYTIPDRIKPVD